MWLPTEGSWDVDCTWRALRLRCLPAASWRGPRSGKIGTLLDPGRYRLPPIGASSSPLSTTKSAPPATSNDVRRPDRGAPSSPLSLCCVERLAVCLVALPRPFTDVLCPRPVRKLLWGLRVVIGDPAFVNSTRDWCWRSFRCATTAVSPQLPQPGQNGARTLRLLANFAGCVLYVDLTRATRFAWCFC